MQRITSSFSGFPIFFNLLAYRVLGYGVPFSATKKVSLAAARFNRAAFGAFDYLVGLPSARQLNLLPAPVAYADGYARLEHFKKSGF